MKKLYLYLLFTSTLLANDPTLIKGKLKEVLDIAQKTLNSQQVQDPLKKGKPEEGEPEKPVETLSEKLERSMNLMSFKAFFSQNSKTKLMVGVDEKVFFLEAKREILLNGETFYLEEFNESSAQFVHRQSNTSLTFHYGR